MQRNQNPENQHGGPGPSLKAVSGGDKLFGIVALKSQLVLPEQLNAALSTQQTLRARGQPAPRLGELLVSKEYMTNDQVHEVLKQQALAGKPLFGDSAVQHHFCSRAEVNAALEKQLEFQSMNIRTPRLGEILVARGSIKRHQIRAVLEAQGKKVVQCPTCRSTYNAMKIRPGSMLRCPRCSETFVPVPTATNSSPAPPLPISDQPDPTKSEQTLFLPAINIIRQEGASPRELRARTPQQDPSSKIRPAANRFRRNGHNTQMLPATKTNGWTYDYNRKLEPTQKLTAIDYKTLKVTPVAALRRVGQPTERHAAVGRRGLSVPKSRSRIRISPTQKARTATAPSADNATRNIAILIGVCGLMFFGLIALIAIDSQKHEGLMNRSDRRQASSNSTATRNRMDTKSRETPRTVAKKNSDVELTSKSRKTSPPATPAETQKAAPTVTWLESPKAPGRKPMNDEEARQHEMGLHLLNEARSLAKRGDASAARDLYQSILGQFGSLHGHTARAELDLLNKGDLSKVPNPEHTKVQVSTPEVTAAPAVPKAQPQPPTEKVKAEPAAKTEKVKAPPPSAEPTKKIAEDQNARTRLPTPRLPKNETPEPVANTARALASVGLTLCKGNWVVTSDGVIAGEPTKESQICTLKKSLPHFQSVSLDLKGTARLAGLSFGHGKRFMAPITDNWQTLALELGPDDRVRMTIDGRARTSEQSDTVVYGDQLTDEAYLRAQEGKIFIRNLTVDGKCLQMSNLDPVPPQKTAEPIAPVVPPKAEEQDNDGKQALKDIGWELISGRWDVAGDVLKASDPNGGLMSLRRAYKPFQKITVEVRGEGDSVGISLGRGLRFLTRPGKDWQELTFETLENNQIGMRINGEFRNSLEEIAKDAQPGQVLYLRADGRNVEFRGLKIE